MAESDTAAPGVPLFPLATVLYPGGLLPLRIFEPRYLDMVRASLRHDTPFGIVPIRHGREVGMTPHFFQDGTLATIESWDRGADGLLHIRVHGDQCFRVLRHEIQANLLLTADIEPIAAPQDQTIPEGFRYLSGLLEEIFKHNREQVPYTEWQLDSALWVAYRLAEVLPMSLVEKVEILRSGDGRAKLSRLDHFVSAIKRGSSDSSHH